MIDWSSPATRGAMLLGVGAVVVLGYRSWKWLSLRRSTQRVKAADWQARDQVSVWYFSGPNCSQCVAQESVVQELRSTHPSLTIEMYDASVDRVTAERVGVLSVPTTVVVDRAGQVTARNGRFVKLDVLAAQVGAAETTG